DDAALSDTLAAVARTPAAARVLALDDLRPPLNGTARDHLTPDDSETTPAHGGTSPAGFEPIQQRGDGLDERLAWAFADAHARRPLPVVLVGMDTPQLTPALLTRAARALTTHDAVFGPATDGGFWLLGLRRPDPALLLGVPMSRPDTGAAQLRRLSGLRVAMLPCLTDVDDAAAAHAVAALAPRTAFARTLARLRLGAAG
ncbi:DUF2064 domain-containing protein, partial [Nonomuraea sp. NN258]|uniref:TIGR04282 family arsenosugar biosynthesis glycosyltransferase n=1 Tax=Nonomuraea antri TaxID=2730852 RepID=UPI00156A2BC6